MTKGELVELIYKALPMSDKITELNLSEGNAVRFSWFGTRYRVTTSLDSETVAGNMLISGSDSMLLTALLTVVSKQQ